MGFSKRRIFYWSTSNKKFLGIFNRFSVKIARNPSALEKMDLNKLPSIISFEIEPFGLAVNFWINLDRILSYVRNLKLQSSLEAAITLCKNILQFVCDKSANHYNLRKQTLILFRCKASCRRHKTNKRLNFLKIDFISNNKRRAQSWVSTFVFMCVCLTLNV